MNSVLTILAVVATIGAVDVIYYHLIRFRLFAQPASAAEEITHLLRHAIFLALLVLLSAMERVPHADTWILGLFAADVLNSAADVLLERRSRAPLGGLPSGESLVHVLASFGMGVTVMAYLGARTALPLPPPSGLLAWQVGGMVTLGTVLLVTELTLFGASRRAQAVLSAPQPAV